MQLKNLHRVSDYEWLISKHDKMLVDGVIVASQPLVEAMDQGVYNQIKAVASLPGVLEKVVALPNLQSGNRFPNGCTAVFDSADGVVCPDAVGIDPYCGIRMITTNLIYQDIGKKIDTLIKSFQKNIHCGDHAAGKISLNRNDIHDLLVYGVPWIIKNRGLGKAEDVDNIEDGGCVSGADPDPDLFSESAWKREKHQLGTIGSGNHYLELQVVEEVYDIEKARIFGLFKNQIVVTFHAGSRDFGRQVILASEEYFRNSMKKYSLEENPGGLLYLPISTPEAKKYMGALRAAANFAYANRQVISHAVYDVFNDIIRDVDTNTMYDISHNTIREESIRIGTSKKRVLIHRRGCTRNFSGNKLQVQEIPTPYKASGHPVMVGSAIGASSYVLSGREESIDKSFSSVMHGTGSAVTIITAPEASDFDHIAKEYQKKGLTIKVKNKEQAMDSLTSGFRDIEEAVLSVTKTGISQRVARLRPIGVMKG